MGVMTCSRNGCGNIMCNRYSMKHGYICSECFSELMNSNLSIKEFMESIKNDFEIKDRFEELNGEFEFRE